MPMPRGERGVRWPMAARRTAPEMCARENTFNRGATGGCAEASAQIWKSRKGKCLTVSKNGRHNGGVRAHHAGLALPKKGVWNFAYLVPVAACTMCRVPDTFFGQSLPD